jgi:hypothetical protein
MNLTVKEGAEAQVPVQEQQKNKVVDSKGRTIKLRELDPLQESRLFLLAGAEASRNMVYMQLYAFPAAMLESIDGELFSVPTSMGALEGRITLLGKAGMDAINKHLREESNAETDSEAGEEAAKN